MSARRYIALLQAAEDYATVSEPVNTTVPVVVVLADEHERIARENARLRTLAVIKPAPTLTEENLRRIVREEIERARP